MFCSVLFFSLLLLPFPLPFPLPISFSLPSPEPSCMFICIPILYFLEVGQSIIAGHFIDTQVLNHLTISDRRHVMAPQQPSDAACFDAADKLSRWQSDSSKHLILCLPTFCITILVSLELFTQRITINSRRCRYLVPVWFSRQDFLAAGYCSSQVSQVQLEEQQQGCMDWCGLHCWAVSI